MVNTTLIPEDVVCLLTFDEPFVTFVARYFMQDGGKKIVRIQSKVDIFVGHQEEELNEHPS